MALGGQLRVSGGAVIGFDLNAAFAMSTALGICPVAVAELLPIIETVAVRETNQARKEMTDG
jgi:hypothetical protein